MKPADRPRQKPLLRAWLPHVLIVGAVLLASLNTAPAQVVPGEPARGRASFRMDLNRVAAILDRLYPARTAKAVWDTIPPYDFSTIPLGNQRYRVPQFLQTDAGRDRKIVDYLALPGYQLTVTAPRTVSFEVQERTEGVFTVPIARRFDLPGVSEEIVPFDSVVAMIWRDGTHKVWRDETYDKITSQVARRTSSARKGITIAIPVPMPRQMESIFGPSEKTHINISGRESITISGETRRVHPFIGVEGRQRQSLFPALDMKQELDVRVTGTIGDKVNIQIDHSSQALSDNANRISVNYRGYDDDVIQLIELGSTSLSLPGSQLVNFSTQSKGLFGVKVLAKLGATDMTLIASKQQGENSSASFSPTGGGIGSAETRILRDVDYVKNRFFYFDHPLVFVGVDESKEIDVYRTVTPQDIQLNPDINRFPGRAFVDRDGFGSDLAAAVDSLRALAAMPPNRPDSLRVKLPPNIQNDFQLLQKDRDYRFVLDSDNNFVGIEMIQPMSDPNKSLAVRYTNRRHTRIGGQYSDFGIPLAPDPAQRDTLVLKLIWPRNPLPDDRFGWTWGYQMRHIYNLGLSNIDGNTFSLEIEDRLNPRLDQTQPQGSDEPYIRIFGLDQFDRSGNPKPDGQVDLNAGLIDFNRGLLAFPTTIRVFVNDTTGVGDSLLAQSAVNQLEASGQRSPFTGFAPDSANVALWTDSTFSFSDPRYAAQYARARRIYEEHLNETDELDANQYLIKVSAVSTSKTFRIDALNIIENSEVVTLDGQRLSRGTDYDIDYNTGEVTLKGGALNRLNPSSRIAIDYEFKPLGGGTSSNLLGFNAISKHGSSRFGTTWLYESKAAGTGRPRVGEEPTRAVVGGVNANIQRDSKALTALVNALPLVDTDARSSFNLNAEAAVSLPDPNTKSEATIDDFEGVEDSDNISLSRRTWHRASPPLLPTPDELGAALPDTARLGFVFYNIEPEFAVTKRDLNPELDQRENSTVPSIDIDLDHAPSASDTTSWAGIMTGFAGGGLDLTQGQFIEIWVNDFTQNPLARSGKLHIDMGTIDEDFFEPEKNEFNDEDKARDGFAASFDDTGLDGLFNADEPGNTTHDPNVDAAGDDINLSRIGGRFTKVNGTEGNRVYDTEDLDHNSQLDQINAYFSYVINLADPAEVDISQEFPDYDGFRNEHHKHDAWRKYRIKLSDAKIVAPNGIEPRFDQIRHIRVWFDNAASVMPDSAVAADVGHRIQLSGLKIQGNRWILDGVHNMDGTVVDSLTAPTDLTLGVISNKSDPGVYVPPFRPNQDASGISDKESSLSLTYDSLAAGTQVRIRKQFTGNGLDLTLYRDLHFWVNTDSLRDGVEYFFRMGSNENNYYEIAVPLNAMYFNSGPGWHRVSVAVSDITQLKFAAPDSDGVSHGTATNFVDSRYVYPIRMRGSPSLFRVRFLYAGIRNALSGANARTISGRVWMDDIYTGSVRRDADFAESVGFSVNLGGGVISLGGSWSRTGPDFRGLRQRRGSGSRTQSISLNGKTNIRHFIPLAGFSIPVTVNYNRSTSKPKFMPNSDTELLDAGLQDSLQSTRESRLIATSLQKRGSKNVLLKYTIDKMTTNFTYNETRSATPASRDTSTSMSGAAGYSINWPARKYITLPVLGWKFRWWINSFSARTAATRRTTQRWRNLNGTFRKDPFLFAASLRNSGSVNYQPFQSLSSTFRMNQQRDAALKHTWLGINVGREIRRDYSTRVGWKPKFRFIRFLQPDVNVQSNYTEDSGPNVRRPGDPRDVRNVTNTRNGSLKMRFDVARYMKRLYAAFGWKVGDDKNGPGARAPGDNYGRGRSGGRPRPSGRPAPVTRHGAQPADSSGTARADSTRHADPLVALRKLGGLLASLRPLNIGVTQRRSSNYSRIPGRPDLGYQLGLSSSSGVAGFDKPERLLEVLGVTLDSGVQVTKDFDVSGRYSRNISDSDFRGNNTRSNNVSWPDVQVRWQGLERIGLMNRYFQTATANLNWKKSRQESGVKGETPISTRENLQISPAMVLTWKNQMNSNLSVSYNKSTSDTRGAKSETTALGVTLDFRKQFRGGSGFKLPIPLFRKKIHWTGQLDANLSLAYTRTGGKRFAEGTPFSEPIPKTTSLRVSPTLSYNFSQALTGRAFIDYGRAFNETSNQTTTTVRVGVNAIFSF